MPFTFSHPAIVLPFIKIRHEAISMSGLVIGSLTPDFEYVIRMKLAGRFSHTIEGMFLLDLPMALISAILFHQVVKKPLIDNLPSYFYSRLVTLRDFNFLAYLGKYYATFLGCLLIGIASHILWDNFTHAHSFFVKHIEFLSIPISINGVREFPLYRYLQHVSTVVGAFIIIIVFHQLPSYHISNAPTLRFWLLVILITSIIFAIRASFRFGYYGDVVITTISATLIGLIISSAIFLQRKLK